MALVNRPNSYTQGTPILSSEVNDDFNTLYNEFNGAISAANLATDAVTTAKIDDEAVTTAKIANNTILPTNFSADTAKGWYDLADVPDTVTYNGNRSYDLVFNSNDLTDTVSNGMRTRFTRTVTPPTQCTDLESGSSQYWSKTSPAGISFTTTFTCSAWVKLESYTAGGIIARMNGTTEGWGMYVESDGRVTLIGRRIAGNHKQINSYQSIPLNKWVHVAACIDMTVADTTAQKIWIDGVEVPRGYILTGTATALVQGTTALVVGAAASAGTSPFDGKIAQASVHSACLSDAQIKAMASQTISSSTPSIVSGFTFNGVATDVTASANDLTASGGATYGTDSPMNATEYGIITANSFSTNTTLTVQVPEGYAIPTSGGVSAVAYSTQDVPYGFPSTSKFIQEVKANLSKTVSTSGLDLIQAQVFVPSKTSVRIDYSCYAASNTADALMILHVFDGALSTGLKIAHAEAKNRGAADQTATITSYGYYYNDTSSGETKTFYLFADVNTGTGTYNAGNSQPIKMTFTPGYI